MASLRGSTLAGASVRLAPIDGSFPSIDVKPDGSGAFSFPQVSAGWYILSSSTSWGETAIALNADGDINVGFIGLPAPGSEQDRIPILTVCEALATRAGLNHKIAVIVGIFKSGMDETLRLDCPFQLVSGEVGWPNAIGLTKVGNVPDELRAEVEKKRQQILSSAPPEAPLRPERVVGLYGTFVSLAGLAAAPCCKVAVETTLPPARLFGPSETDLRVIR